MPQPQSGPGLGLPIPSFLYPSELNNAPYDIGTNRVALAPGTQLPIPAGTWYIASGGYLVVQYQDPLTGAWSFSSGAAYQRGIAYVKSDGFTCRLANLTGCLVGAVITSAGSSYVQATTTITVTGSTGLLTPIVGGQLGVYGGTLANVGAGYGVPPIVVIPNPPPPANNANGVGGVAAAAYAVIASGTVSGVTFANPGAGYPAAPANVALLPNPTDPNLATGITLATVAFSLTGSGSITGVICTQNGATLTPANITLSVSGAGSTATLSALVMQTVTAATFVSPGVGYDTGTGYIGAVGGVPSQGTITNGPEYNYLAWFPRPVNIGFTGAASISAGTAGVVYDGGLFLAAPTAFVNNGPGGGSTITTVGTVAFVMGNKVDIATMQPAP